MNTLRSLIRALRATPRSPIATGGTSRAASVDKQPNTARPACCSSVRGLCTVPGSARKHGRPFHR